MLSPLKFEGRTELIRWNARNLINMGLRCDMHSGFHMLLAWADLEACGEHGVENVHLRGL